MTTLSPYAQRLGILRATAAADEPGAAPVLHLPPAEHLLGRPGFLHGGALATLLEAAALLALRQAIGEDDTVTATPIASTIDYLRGARSIDSFARGHLIRQGTRIAAVAAEAWQDDPTRPTATARLNFSLTRS